METRKGFSLLELAVVLVLVVLMAAVCTPQWKESKTLADVTQAQQDLDSLAAAQWTHYQEHGRLFSPAGGVVQSGWFAWLNSSSFPPNGPNNFAHACSTLWETGSFYDNKGDSSGSQAASPPNGTVHYDLRTLTSPLGYLSLMPTDPFKATGQGGRMLTYESFVVDVRASFVFRGLGPDMDADSGCGPLGFDCACSGPFCLSLNGKIGEDRPFDPAFRTEFECPGCATLKEALTFGGTVYSPTNGSNSNGDIYVTSADTVPVGGPNSAWILW